MKPILGREGLKKLESFATSRTAIVLDYDGTISPISLHYGDAIMKPDTKRLLASVAKLYPTAILSGRKLSDLASRVRGLGVRESVGNHGLEWRGSHRFDRYETLMRFCKRELDQAIRTGEIRGEGVDVENKKFTLSVHYRMSPNHDRAYREIFAVLAKLRGTQIIEGKEVFNLLPRANVNKGTAVLELKKKFRCDKVIFAGDDWTDEKVFELRPKPFLLDIRVGRTKRSRARYYVPGVEGVDRLLEELIRLRRV